MKGYPEDAWARAMRIIPRGGTSGGDFGDFRLQPTALVPPCGTTSSTATMGSLTGGAAGPAPSGCRWRWWKRCCGSIRSVTPTSACATFTRSCGEEHGIELSYTWVKLALQGAGRVKKARQRGVHRKRRPRRPLPGMLLHLDGSPQQWFQDERWYDLIKVLDDATSETYYAQLVAEESTRTVLAALQEVSARKGLFCALYSDRASHFSETPKASPPAEKNGGAVDVSPTYYPYVRFGARPVFSFFVS